MKMKLKLITAMSALLASVSTQAMSINDLMLVNSEALEGESGDFHSLQLRRHYLLF
ncbi:hypothetical protein [Vibrio parahaemolyticus]|uniref:hypothetical protein n=1 Tax=Vibrio parahaemolyticus TaxID=670 RepID=UPI0020C180FB|nr:hypothetical protein [Vibrio parahaemolyticus]